MRMRLIYENNKSRPVDVEHWVATTGNLVLVDPKTQDIIQQIAEPKITFCDSHIMVKGFAKDRPDGGFSEVACILKK